MSHLGEQLSALVDGELSGAELDRANAHVAACGACRVEANALRRLKHELRSLAEVHDVDAITARLLAMTSPSRAQGAPSLADLVYPAGPAPAAHQGRGRGRRYALWTTLSLVVVGVGTAAFSMGGNPAGSGPQITPQLEVFDIQHAITAGDVPFADPADMYTRVPVVATTP